MFLFKKIWNLFFPVNTKPIESEKEETLKPEVKKIVIPIPSLNFTPPVIIEAEEKKEKEKEIEPAATKKKKPSTKNTERKEESESKPTGKKKNVQGVSVEKRSKKK